MSSYIKDFDWSEYQDNEESLDDYYLELEQKDQEQDYKRRTKMSRYEGYNE